VSLVECVFRAPRLGCPIIYGVSNNDSTWWDNRHVDYLGWAPKDNAETFRTQLDATLPRPGRDAPDAIYQGGVFTADGIHEE
jgi:uronate dehydrogenase